MLCGQKPTTGTPFLFYIIALWLSANSLGAGAVKEPTGPEGFPQWQAKRAKSIGGTNGWSSLAGLFWLHEGTNSLGAAVTNDIRLPAGHAPESVGVIVRHGFHARFAAHAPDVARIAGRPVTSARMKSDENQAKPTVLNVGELNLTVIKRGERFGVRVRDPQAPTRLHFQGLDYWPYQPEWRIDAHLEKSAHPKTLLIGDVTGVSAHEKSPGTIAFTFLGKEYRLDALEDEETHDLFILFRDESSGDTTYPGGRFVHAPFPKRDGKVVLDFNYAYNPPCAFTHYATCPIPPRQNSLPFAVEAGEKKYRGGHGE